MQDSLYIDTYLSSIGFAALTAIHYMHRLMAFIVLTLLGVLAWRLNRVAGLRIQSRLNGQVMQDADTADMVFGVARTIALLSECLTLEPGDVLVMRARTGERRWMRPPPPASESELAPLRPL